MPLFFTKQLFKRNVMIFGEIGTGKDLLMANIIARRKSKYYISPFDYKITNKIFKKHWIKLDVRRLCLDNNYRNFINSDTNLYFYPYPEKVDIYLPDVGVYFLRNIAMSYNAITKICPLFLLEQTRQAIATFIATVNP